MLRAIDHSSLSSVQLFGQNIGNMSPCNTHIMLTSPVRLPQSLVKVAGMFFLEQTECGRTNEMSLRTEGSNRQKMRQLFPTHSESKAPKVSKAPKLTVDKGPLVAKWPS